jgi:WhiB family transcriptional regulator, redox-sensing transcriptional regulator
LVGAIIAELSTKLAFDAADERTWMLEAKCLDADPEAFFPEKGGSTRRGEAHLRRLPRAR